MNRLEKIGILLVSALLTFIGFSLMVAPVVDILKVGRLAGYEIIGNYLARTGAAGLSSSYSRYLKLPIELLLMLGVGAIILYTIVKIKSAGKMTDKRPTQRPHDQRPRLGQFQIPDSKTES